VLATKETIKKYIIRVSRPHGVTASAVVAILGSVFTLLIAAAGVASLFIVLAEPQPPNSRPAVIGGAAMLAAFSGIGIWTAVGLFRLRPWARTSILIFAGFLAACSLFGLLVTTTIPMPPEVTRGTQQGFRLTMAFVYGIPLAIAVWWLIQFNKQSTKAAFASPLAEPATRRPMSITVIAWMSIVGGVSCFFPLLSRTPAFLFGAILNGWAASVVYACFAALSLYIGKGLLELREEARVLGIGWFAFSLVHTSLITLVPPLRERMYDLQRTLVQNQPTAMPLYQGMMTTVILVFAVIVSAGSIWFLVRNRAAFARAESPAIG
jgi:hypothetical protein